LLQEHGVDDQSRWREAYLGDVLWLLHALRRRRGEKISNVEFRHAAPLWNKDKDPKNAGSYFGYLNQAHYVDGVAAGLSTKSNKIGFVAAKPIASVLSNINSVLLGARSSNPNAIVQVIFTGDWSLPVREAEAANALVDAGCDVITCHVDGRKS
jgi:simple sugar transport system substrate-binding protein